MAETPADLNALLQNAIDHLQHNRFAAAESVLRDVLARDANQPDAWHYLGVAALQQGRLQEAYDSIQRSLAISQNFAAFNNLGHVLRAAGRGDDALACFDRAAQLAPGHPDAYWNAALLLAAAGRHEQAAAALQRVVAIAPQHPRVHLMLGISLVKQRYYERAVASFNQHLKLHPNDAEAHGRRSAALALLRRFDEAAVAAQRALELAPDRPEAHNNLGWVLERGGKLAEAEPHFRRAIELHPQFVLAIGNLASLCERTERGEEAMALYERAAAIDPRHVEAQCAVAGSYSKFGRYAESLAATERALAVKPHDPGARGHRSLALLAFGDYERGFAEYEWRWECKDFTTPSRDFPQPRYRGGDAAGRTVLIHSEQGYGDNIQFARYLPLLAGRGAKVLFECPVPLRRLMETVPGVAQVIPGGLRPPPFDLQAPLLSLPHAFKTALPTVPCDVPYFRLPEADVQRWRDRLVASRRKLVVGLLWRGNSKPNPRRSIPIEQLAPLARDDVTFVSLQVGDHAREAAAAPPGMQLIDCSGEIGDFYDLACLIAAVDRVITIDSGPAHLAGALGKPTQTMLIRAADWRWLQDRADSPWYPSMRLYRQTRAEVWEDVIAAVAADLAGQGNRM